MSSLAAALQAWTLARTGHAALARAVALAVQAEAEGHACVRLSIAAEPVDPASLHGHPWVASLTPGALAEVSGQALQPRPGVLVGDDFYLWRNWRHEQRLAQAITQRVDEAASEPVAAALQADLELLHAGMDRHAVADQRAAVAQALGRRLFVLSGGPGTGKTTTVLRLLLLWLRQRAGTDGRIALAAPTGKAAQRLGEAVRAGLRELSQRLGDEADWQACLQRIPQQASTLHRLLGAMPAEDRFRYGPDDPLPCDLLVVDEASMVDLAMMRALFDALAPTTALLLIGDPDQLVSVAAGSVLADLVAVAEAAPQAPLGQHAARLNHVWRAQAELAALCALTRVGDAGRLLPAFAAAADSHWHEVSALPALRARLGQWLQHADWSELLDTARQDAQGEQVFTLLRRRQLLCALREGAWGSLALAAAIDQQLRQQAQAEAAADGTLWYPGRAIVIRQNDYGRRLYNGDVGIAVGSGDALRVLFEGADDDAAPRRSLSPHELPAHDLAFALSVHKSQGSEYDRVAVLLPPDPGSRILSRQLLYTALSRARSGVELWSSEASLRAALAQRVQRHGGLRGWLGTG